MNISSYHIISHALSFFSLRRPKKVNRKKTTEDNCLAIQSMIGIYHGNYRPLCNVATSNYRPLHHVGTSNYRPLRHIATRNQRRQSPTAHIFNRKFSISAKGLNITHAHPWYGWLLPCIPCCVHHHLPPAANKKNHSRSPLAIFHPLSCILRR